MFILQPRVPQEDLDDQGDVWYGKQRYAAVVLYQPEFENPSTAEYFQRGLPEVEWQGASPDHEGELPDDLQALCKNRIRPQVPVPLVD